MLFLHVYLNLPREIRVEGAAGKGAIRYYYDAAGNKLRKVTIDSTTLPAKQTVTTYIGGIVYQNDTLQFFGTSEGRARPDATDSFFVYDYFLKDHLSNTRMVITDDYSASSPIMETSSYYPFGLMQKAISHVNPVLNQQNKYLYNSKELQEETGVYDFETRNYDPVIARMTTIDPHAENSRRWSPYAYGENNPIRNIDPDGMDVVETAQGTTYTGADAQAAFVQLQSQQNNKPKDRPDGVINNDPIAGKTPSDNDGGKNDVGGKKDGSKGSSDIDGKQSLQEMKKNPPNVPSYKPPKSGARKVRNPNGKGTGWIDRDGRVWVPDDHKGTHAPHWDVQNPTGGGYTPVYPTVAPVGDPSLRQKIGNAVGLSGVGLTIYLIISEGSRLFPPRNLIPIP